MSISRRTDRVCGTQRHTYTEQYYPAIKNEILPLVIRRMDLANIISEVSQAEKDKYPMTVLLCESKKKQTK